jgi:hypothetical protein
LLSISTRPYTSASHRSETYDCYSESLRCCFEAEQSRHLRGVEEIRYSGQRRIVSHLLHRIITSLRQSLARESEVCLTATVRSPFRHNRDFAETLGIAGSCCVVPSNTFKFEADWRATQSKTPRSVLLAAGHSRGLRSERRANSWRIITAANPLGAGSYLTVEIVSPPRVDVIAAD